MPRQVYVYRDGKFVLREEVQPEVKGYVIPDSMDDTWHPADGKYYGSKSKFRETTKAHGLVEYGNEDPRKCAGSRPTLTKEKRIADIRRAYEQAVHGNRK